MGVPSWFFKAALLCLNSLLLTLGCVMMTLGILLIAGVKLTTYIETKFENELDKVQNQTGLQLPSTGINLKELFVVAGMVTLIIGCIVAALAAFGFVAILCSFKFMLRAYAIILTAVFLPQLILFIIIQYNDGMFRQLMSSALKASLSDYTGLLGTDETTLTWNAIMTYEQCCGIDNYLDFHEPPPARWPPAAIEGYVFTNQITPVICCKNFTIESVACAERGNATEENNNMYEGCFSKLYQSATGHPALITAALIALAIQALCIAMVVWIYCSKGMITGLIL